MNRDLNTLLSLRKVLTAISEGSGLAGALVTTFRSEREEVRSVARMTLLGHPPEVSLAPILNRESAEIAMLSSLIANAATGSTGAVGRKGDALSRTLEKWLKAREGRRLQQRVFRLRGLIVSAVLGGVLGMVSELGPIVGGLSFTGTPVALDPAAIQLSAAFMAALSSAMLGLFISGRGFFLNVCITLAVFGIVSVSVAPLTAVTAPNLWGIK